MNIINNVYRKFNSIVAIEYLMSIALLVIFSFSPHRSAGQNAVNDTSIYYLQHANSYARSVEEKAEKYTEKLDKQAIKYLGKLQKQEQKLQRKLKNIDSSAAVRIFATSKNNYSGLIQKIKTKSAWANGLKGKYDPQIDSMVSSLKFIQTNADLLKGQEGLKDVTGSLTKLRELQSSLAQSEEISKYIRERKTFLKEQLSKYNFKKYLKRFNQQVYYYNQQVNEYRDLLKDQKKIEAKTLELLCQLPAFKDFMKKHSMLAAMFPMQGTENSLSRLEGLQARVDIEQQLQQRFGSSGINPNHFTQQQIGNAQSEIGKLKDKLVKAGGNTDMVDMPNFKPNTQKTKSFFKRIELSSNIQTQKSSQYLPSIADLGLSAGYRLNDKSVIGVGASYKLGLGPDIQHIRFSHEGLGLRSFVDVKIKGNFWISGGGEMNYRAKFKNIDALKEYSQWQRSMLIGLNKKYKVSGKMKGNLQLLYDFLYREQLPKGQPISFRLGYGL